MTGVGLGRPAAFADRVGCIAAIHPFQVDRLGPDFTPDDLAFPSAIQASPDGLLQGEDQADWHLGRVV